MTKNVKFTLRKSYNWAAIEQFADVNNYQISEHGKNIIGINFIVLNHNDRDINISFVLTGYSSVSGNQYTCIYTDL